MCLCLMLMLALRMRHEYSASGVFSQLPQHRSSLTDDESMLF
jgi:hypothetical protein